MLSAKIRFILLESGRENHVSRERLAGYPEMPDPL
jgi:hypothetical protein